MIFNSLQNNLGAWANIGANDVVLDWIRQGVPIPFKYSPPCFVQPNGFLSRPDVQFIDSQIASLLLTGVIIRCDPGQLACVSPIKCIAKKKGSKRLLVNLHELNQYIHTPKFRCEGIENVAGQIQSADILMSIDLKDGFFHVPVHPDFRKYLGICWRNNYYAWCSLPQGLACSPYYFYKVLRPVVQYLRENLVRVNLYVDDFLLMIQRSYVTDHRDLLINTLQELGWNINFEKSDLSVTTNCVYVGFDIESDGPDNVPWLSVTRKRISKLKKDIRRCLYGSNITVRRIACVAGQCISMTKAILPAKLLLQNIYRFIADRESWDSITLLCPEVVKELEWWNTALDSWNGSPLQLRQVDCQLETDASGSGWGACLGNMEASGLWTQWVGHMPSNYRELLAVGQAVRSFGPWIQGRCVQILSDNITTVACINHMYSVSTTLGELAQSVWYEARKWNVDLKAKYLAGKDNVHADALSRIRSPYEWSLSPRVFEKLERLWGPHSIDRCASMMTAKLPIYNSLYHDPNSAGVDCLAQTDWADHNNYVNPPFWIIPRILKTLVGQKASATLIAPWWPAQPWFRELVNMTVDWPVPIPNTVQVIQQVLACPEPRKNIKWKLYAWRVSGRNV